MWSDLHFEGSLQLLGEKVLERDKSGIMVIA